MKWALATEKNSSLKPTKTTSEFYFPIPFIIHIVAFFVPKRNPAHPLPKPSMPSSSLPIPIVTLHLRRQWRFSSLPIATIQTPATLQFPIVKIQTPATLLLWPATLQLSIAGDASSFATSNRDASALDRWRCFILHNIRRCFRSRGF